MKRYAVMFPGLSQPIYVKADSRLDAAKRAHNKIRTWRPELASRFSPWEGQSMALAN